MHDAGRIPVFPNTVGNGSGVKGYEISLELMAMMIGIVSIIIAVRYALFFSRSRKAIARAMMFMLVAEALASGTTCAFNALAIADLIRVAPPIVMVSMPGQRRK